MYILVIFALVNQMVGLKNIRNFSLDEIKTYLSTLGEPAFRAKQIYEWLWVKSARNFDEMSNLSKTLREKLKENLVINPVETHHSQFSADKTIKNAFKLYDGNIIEGVLIPTPERMTACVSSQVGCSLTCKFCATGYMERKRNLDAAEIYDQVVLINKQAQENYGLPLTNIVYMGMGDNQQNKTSYRLSGQVFPI